MAETPRVVVNVSLTGPERDQDEKVTFLGHPFRIVRVGTNGHVRQARKHVRQWADKADAIAVSGFHEAVAKGLYDGELEQLRSVKRATARVPVTDGTQLTPVLQEWAIRHVQSLMPGFFNNARTVVLGGVNHDRTTRILREYTSNISFADPLLRFEVPEFVESNPVLGVAADAALWPLKQLPKPVKSRIKTPGTKISAELTRRAAKDCDVIVAQYDELVSFGLEELAGKTVVTSAVTEERLAELAARGVDLVIDWTPQPFEEITVSPAVLEAIMRSLVPPTDDLGNDELLDMIVSAGLEPRLLQPNGPKRKSRFVFVIHPLSQQYFRNVEALRPVLELPLMGDVVEKVAAYMPPLKYSHVTGITSPTGAEAEGWLVTVGGTPKELMAHSPEFTYSRLLDAAEMATKLGAQIMGLGAFTKVVGDAGVTVAKKAPLPITTGNSYSASGALWAAHDAIDRLGLVPTDDKGRIHGKTMVVGATGAIGSVCARLLALASDEVWLVSPETAKLLALKKDIELHDPRARIRVAATPDDHLDQMDLIVTATSGAGKRILDITRVKPGCVITDVARPLDLSAEDVAKRPDVLVIESGEIELPGEVQMKDIGLPDGVAYACLAETIVLALEGRYETFTIGRNIEWEKVKEIYQLGLKHGMKLATISGVNGIFTDADIARVRRLALEARGESGGGAAKRGSRKTAKAAARPKRVRGASTRKVTAADAAKPRVVGAGEAVGADYPSPAGPRCPRCGAAGTDPCATPSGTPTRTHKGREVPS